MHTFKNNNKYINKTILEMFILKEYIRLEELEAHIGKLRELQAPAFVIENFQKEYASLKKKLDNKTYKPTLSYKDGLDKNILNLNIIKFIEEYNRSDKLVSYIINNEIKINFNTRYCPIVNKYSEV